MKKTAVFDIEATNWIDFACLGFFDGEDYQVFWSVEGLLDHFLTKKYRGFNCWAHFGGKYDFRFLIPALVDSGKYTLKFLERNSKIMTIKVIDNKSRYSWKFSDSFFLLPLSLKALGAAFKIKYMKEDFNPEQCKTIEDWAKPEPQKYLRYDCLGLYEILEKFSNWGLNGGVLKATLPSQSMHIFKTKFLKTSLVQLSEAQEEFVRRTYFGGRVEIFRMKGEDLFYYDFNSLYPFVMLNDMPTGRPLTVNYYDPHLIGFYKIEADIKDVHIPPLPVVHQKKLYFPKGKGVFYTTSAELKILLRLGYDFKILEGVVFEKKSPIFKEYILKMYEIKQRSQRDSMDFLLSKLLMNSLYGKTGQRRDNQEMIFSEKPEAGWIPYDERFGLYLQDKKSRSRMILPYLASYVTSLARARLYEKMEEVGLKNVWYCDTDSIITNKRLKTGENLGDLKLEYQIKKAVFLQPKAYAFQTIDGQEIVKVKGMKEIKLGVCDFIKALKTGEMERINSKYFNIMGFRETMRRNKSLKIDRKIVYKKLNSLYDKRIINEDLTEAFEFENLERGSI